MKIASIITIILIIATSSLILGQLWFQFLEPALFLKIAISLAVFGLATGLIALICRQYLTENKLRRDKFLE